MPDHDADVGDHADVIESEQRIELTAAARQTKDLLQYQEDKAHHETER